MQLELPDEAVAYEFSYVKPQGLCPRCGTRLYSQYRESSRGIADLTQSVFNNLEVGGKAHNCLGK